MKKLNVSQYGKILFELTKDLRGEALNIAVYEFVCLVKKNQAWKKMSGIVEAFHLYTRKEEGRIDLTLISAKKTSPEIRAQIAKHFTGTVEFKLVEDVSLIGGIKVQSDNTIFDASIQTQLQKMKKTLV
ncbi:MAG: F0F1 ATP synthase subunit delta [Candidatus Magasanikbacteria bacterium]|nr:F0F1 ATP synthase subunit delta [Candidatus Magasanikbacteria bacterium]